MSEEKPYSRAMRIISLDAQVHALRGDNDAYEEAHEALNELLDEQEKRNSDSG